MYEALTAKFTQNKELLKLLLETNDRYLVEDSPHDPYWGIGKDKKGYLCSNSAVVRVDYCGKRFYLRRTSALYVLFF